MSEKLQGAYLASLANNCVSDYVANKRPERTVTNLKNFLGRFLRWIEDRELTPKECRAYVKYMQLEKKLVWTSVSSDTRRLKMFLTWLSEEANECEGIIDRNWGKEVHSPKRYGMKEAPQEQLLSSDKMMEYVLKVTEPGPNDHKLHRATKLEHREFLLFYMKMGIRPGEAMNIKPENVNLDSDHPNVLVWRGKNGKWQPLGLPLEYLEPVRRRVAKGRWFDVNQKRLQIYMQRISKMAGRTVNLYSIRKSVDTYAMEADAPIMKAASHQGHTVATMEQYYTKFSAKQSSEFNNTYNPFIDRTKLPVKFVVPRIDNLVKVLERHPAISIEKWENNGEHRITISWKDDEK